jgi:hypothetical protein
VLAWYIGQPNGDGFMNRPPNSLVVWFERVVRYKNGQALFPECRTKTAEETDDLPSQRPSGKHGIMSTLKLRYYDKNSNYLSKSFCYYKNSNTFVP